MNRKQVLANLCEAQKFFKGTCYEKIVVRANNKWSQNHSIQSIQKMLNTLPTDQQLISKLVEQLKGKSIYKNLKRLGKHKNTIQEAKALSSLLTHAIISVEQGQIEYRKLFPVLLTRINEKIYSIIK